MFVAFVAIESTLGCEALFPLDGLGDGAHDAQASDGSVVQIEGGDDGGCVSEAGPSMVRAGTFCIDSTEVTTAEYTAFVSAKNGDTSGQPTYCSWNVSFTPNCGPLGAANPVACVDWCDAYAYCAWAGKELCGGVGGGSVAVSSAASASENAWYSACSQGGARTYPYGNSYDSTACNGGDLARGGSVAAGSLPKCEGGYPGLFDMSGNLEEWTNACAASAGANDACQIRGGSWQTAGDTLTCSKAGAIDRQGSFTDTGFRCCSI